MSKEALSRKAKNQKRDGTGKFVQSDNPKPLAIDSLPQDLMDLRIPFDPVLLQQQVQKSFQRVCNQSVGENAYLEAWEEYKQSEDRYQHLDQTKNRSERYVSQFRPDYGTVYAGADLFLDQLGKAEAETQGYMADSLSTLYGGLLDYTDDYPSPVIITPDGIALDQLGSQEMLSRKDSEGEAWREHIRISLIAAAYNTGYWETDPPELGIRASAMFAKHQHSTILADYENAKKAKEQARNNLDTATDTIIESADREDIWKLSDYADEADLNHKVQITAAQKHLLAKLNGDDELGFYSY